MSLYDLQAQWDEDRTRARIAALRADLRPRLRRDMRWLPLVLVLVCMGLAGLAGIGPA